MPSKNKHPALSAASRWLAGAVVLVLLAGGAGGARAQSSMGLRFEEIPSVPAVDHSSSWDEIDRQVDLTGLWGSIDPYLDGYGFLYTRDTDGTLFLIFSKWNGLFYEVVYASRAVGESWSPLFEIQSEPDTTLDNIKPQLISDPNGHLHAVWTRKTGASSGGSVYHAVQLGGAWTAPVRISGTENARGPVLYIDAGRTLVDYRTPFARVTVEIIVYVSAGGSDDIDPGVEVQHDEIQRLMLN
jgi:hypothetical protein